MADDASHLRRKTVANAVKNELERQDFYHGFRPKKDVTPLLKETGDFLVRATDNHVNKSHLIVISIKYNSDMSGVKHLTLTWKNNKWALSVLKKSNTPTFDTIVELINFYKEHKTPLKVRLKRGISRPQWHIKHDKVIFDKTRDLLGSGNFCHVYKGIYQKSAEEQLPVAVKIWHEGSAPDKEATDEGKEARNAMLSEAQIMSYYSYRHIIQLFGVACDHPPVLIVMEFCPGGNLEQHLRTQGDKMDTGERILYGYEAAKGMRYLHSKKCVHRDLAARNCLISDRGYIKISDFGLSQLAGDEGKHDVAQLDEEEKEGRPGKGNQVPVRWMAPESLRRPALFSAKSDVWSFGVLLYEIFNNGEKPWLDDPPKRIATHIRKGKMPAMPEKTTPEVRELVARIWVQEPEQRPDMKNICQQMHDICRRCKFPPANKLTVNTLFGVHRSMEDLDDTIIEAEDDGQDVVTRDLGAMTLVDRTDNLENVKQPKSRDRFPEKKKKTASEVDCVGKKDSNRKDRSASKASKSNDLPSATLILKEAKSKKPKRKKTSRREPATGGKKKAKSIASFSKVEDTTTN